MNDQDLLATRFEQQRPQLRAIAYRMLGTYGEADDAVQEAWLRLSRSEADGIDNVGGWLTTVVSRVCLDQLRTRRSRREDPLDDGAPHGVVPSPETDVAQADSLGAALLVVLDTLSPAERLAFVLHDLFAMPFEEIAPMVERTPAAARQLASRARRRVRGAAAPADRVRQRELVEAFLAASRRGDFERLLSILDPDVVMRADDAAVAAAQASPHAPAVTTLLRGGRDVASAMSGRAPAARLAVIDGAFGAVWAPGGTVRSAFVIDTRDGQISTIELVVEPEHLAALDIEILD